MKSGGQSEVWQAGCKGKVFLREEGKLSTCHLGHPRLPVPRMWFYPQSVVA